MSDLELVGVLVLAVMGGFGAGWIVGSFYGFKQGYWAEHPDEDGRGWS